MSRGNVWLNTCTVLSMRARYWNRECLRVPTLEQASPKLMTDIIKRITHVYEKLNENDTTLGGQLNILKEDVNLFMSQLDDVKIAADHVKKKTIERMAEYETQQQQQKEQIDALKKQIKTLEDIIRL
eukprot:4734685-Amphidinium_carterae.1